ncbi:T9SS type A sorting domain-containing protein [uncultured Dokdonia sp.]|uniref:T9SS type A sorting domain-containing protein n=1 Tax=uncultured Dokdonia sp. TaxID=575653 RepID=UPI00261FB55B|nr:T9SS type A sorting domain-containing protein [uncultured Dokdonia sp.]
MKTKLLVLTLFICGFVSTMKSQDYLDMIEAETFSVQEIIESGETYFENRDKGRGSGYKQFKRWEYMALRLMNEEGFLPTTQQKLETLASYNSYLNETAQNQVILQDNWEELGPMDWTVTSGWNPGVGRITGIAIDPTDSDIMIIGGHRGGVWKTTDGGQNWTPLNDNFVNLSVYSVAIDPLNPNIYYYGSSSGMIFRSTDAGATFSLLADLSQSRIIKILIHPTNTDIIFVSSENAGTFRSTDGGVTWNNVTSEGRSYDIEFMPGNPSVVYASGFLYHKSTDGGQTFTTINSAGFSNVPKMMAVSPDDANVVYLLQGSGGFEGLFKSEDIGDSFTELDHTGRNYLNLDQNGVGTGGQAPRDMDIAVSPSNIDEVHIGGGNTWRSLDGGITFELNSFWFIPEVANLNVGYNHADIDMLLFDGNTLLTGTDGGIFKANDPGGPITTDFWEDLTAGLGIREFYKLGIAQTIDQKISGGSQDNGTSLFQDGSGWTDWLGADGGESFVDKNNNDRIYGTTQFGNMWISNDNGITVFNPNHPNNEFSQGNFVTPFEQDPVVQDRIYIGYNEVYRSNNGGGTWTPVSQDISTTINGFNIAIEHFKIAPSNNEVLYASVNNFSSGNANFYRTEDGGATDWVQMTTPGGFINSIAVHPTNPDLVAVATTSNNRVLISNDGGATWESCKKNLPDFAAMALVWDDNTEDGLYLGMDFGIYYIDNTLDEWEIFNNNLPNVIISELEINNETDMIYAATFGRGLWVSPTVDPLLSTEDFISEDNVTVFPNPATTEIFVTVDTASEGDIRLYDITGKLVVFQKDVLLDSNYRIDLSRLESGTYFLRINTTSGSVTKKILRK